jgi:hypothetical protein
MEKLWRIVGRAGKNRKAAKQIGITLPYELLARANRVIK